LGDVGYLKNNTMVAKQLSQRGVSGISGKLYENS